MVTILEGNTGRTEEGREGQIRGKEGGERVGGDKE